MFKFLNWDKEDFRVAFRAFIATISLVFAGAYTWNVTFLEEGETVSKHGEFILGFLLGTLVATLYNYYYGGNDNAEKQIRDSSGRASDGTPAPDDDRVSTEREVISGDGS